MPKLGTSAWLGIVLVYALGNAAWAAPQVIRGHLPKAATADSLTGPLGDEVSVDLVIGLPLKDPEGLDGFLKDVYDPHSPLFRKFLTPDQFTDRFCPPTFDYEAVVNFLKSKGMLVTATYPNRLMVGVKATAADIRKIFRVNLNHYHRPDGRLFYAPNTEPSIDLQVPIEHITGLDNFNEPKPKFHRGAAVNGKAAKLGTGPSGYYMGKDFRNAYVPDVPSSLDGSGQNVGLVEFDGFYQADISFYKSNSNPPVIAPAPITVLINGFSGTPSTSNADYFNVYEVSLDIEMVNAIAPGAQVVVYEASPTAGADVSFDSMLQNMANSRLCAQISSSWGGFGDSTARNLLNQLAAQGQAYFEAAGDNGAYDVPGANPTPALGKVSGDPSLSLSSVENLVGGTELAMTGSVYTSESTWNDGVGKGGGGFCANGSATLLAIPPYQTPVPMGTNNGSTVYRNFPDVSAAAASIYLVTNNSQAGTTQSYAGPIWGTSASSPLWAGFLSLVNQQGVSLGKGTLGSPNNALYALALTPTTYSNDFHDINDGSNNNYTGGANTLYTAVTGFDLATGWGSPKGQSLVNDLVGMFPTFTPTFTRTPTPVPCNWPGPTCTLTFTPTPTVTPTPTPTQILSKLGQVVLAPVPVAPGGKICLFPDNPTLNSQWDVFNFTGESVASLSFPNQLKNCWDTTGIGPGVYMIRIKLKYADGSDSVVWKKIIIKR